MKWTICVCSDNYPTKGHPVFAFVGQLCEAFAKQNVDVIVVAPQSFFHHLIKRKKLHPSKITYNDFGQATITVYQPYVYSLGMRYKRVNAFFTRWAFNRVLHRVHKEIDIYYGHFWHNAYNLFPYAKKYHKPLFVATGEETILLGRNRIPSDLKDFCNYVSGVICVSSKNKEESISLGLTDGNNCKVIPNAIDDSTFKLMDKAALRQKYGYDKGAFIVVFVGWYILRKGPHRVAEAIRSLGDDDIFSFFIGEPSNSENIQPECPGILYKGRVDHDKLPEYLNMADIFVLPTLSEGCCNALVEAMACGLPIVSSNRSFNWDILNEKNSIMVDPENIQEIAKAIKILKDDTMLRESKARGAILTAQKLTLTNRAETILKFIEKQIS